MVSPIKVEDKSRLLNCCHCFNSPCLATSPLPPLLPPPAFLLYFCLLLSSLCASPPFLFCSVNLFLYSKAPSPSSALLSPLFPLNSLLLLSPKPSSSLSIHSIAARLCSLSWGPSAPPSLPTTDLLAHLEKIWAGICTSKMVPAAGRALKGHWVCFQDQSQVLWFGQGELPCGLCFWRGLKVFWLSASFPFHTCPPDMSSRARCSPGFASCIHSVLNKQKFVVETVEWSDVGSWEPWGGGFIMFMSSGFASATDCCRRFSKSFNLSPSSVSPVG